MKSPTASPGKMTDRDRFQFETSGYLIIKGALSKPEVAECLKAAKRVHEPHPRGVWRQLGATFQEELAFEKLIDHSSVLPKVRALLGDHFILQSSWSTVVPPDFKGGGFHQDGSGPYEFRRLATPVPLVQLRIGYFLTDQSQPNMGNMTMIPGTHNVSMPLPRDEVKKASDLPICDIITGEPGDALMFHQGVYHLGGPNEMDYDRHIIHMVYSPPWLIPSDRMGLKQAFLDRTTPLRRALVGNWSRPEEPFGVGYEKPPFVVSEPS